MHYRIFGHLFAILMMIGPVAFLRGQSSGVNATGEYRYTIPGMTSDGWETAHMSSEAIDTDIIHDLFDRVIDYTYKNVHSVLIVKNGKLVVEEYFAGMGADGLYHAYQRDTLHTMQSATKSVNSILIGIAIDQHLIRGVDERVSSFFPEYRDIFADSSKAQIRLRDCLSMTTGLDWDEWKIPYTDARNHHVMMNSSADPIRFNLERAVVVKPGTKFVYNSGLSIALVRSFSRSRAFGPTNLPNDISLRHLASRNIIGGNIPMEPCKPAEVSSSARVIWQRSDLFSSTAVVGMESEL